VRLEPLTPGHVPDLKLAATEDRDTFGFTLVPRPEDVADYVAAQLDREGLTPFAQIRVADGRAVGCTAYWSLRTWPDSDKLFAIEVGFTWLAPSAQRTGINADAKLLLFGYAFEKLGVQRVDLKTDARNVLSRRAIAATGARFEGVLRNWSPSWAPGEDGMLRDSAVFSVTADEWPEVRSALTARVIRRTEPPAES
jgi:RimJ/RimL family protein N-acetyltransferase